MEVENLLLTSPFIHIVKNQITELLESEDDDNEVQMILQQYVTVPRVSVVRFYEDTVPQYSDEEFIRYFRLSRDVFFELALQYENCDLYKKVASQSAIIPPDKSLALFLWFCASTAEGYRKLSNLFDVPLSTVYSVIRRTISFLSSLSPRIIKWPTMEEMIRESDYHLQKYGIPGIIGAVDGTHIRIDPPPQNKDDYIDLKGDLTLLVQAVCNHEYKFIHVSIGYPGSVHDARAFRCSSLPEELEMIPLGYRILGDSAYPCQVKVLPLYKDNGHLTVAQKYFNYKLSSSRVMIEHAFGILKQRFRQLYYCRLKGNRTLCHFIRACFVLHNLANATDLEIMNINPTAIDPHEGSYPADLYDDDENANEGKILRNAICASLTPQTRR